MSKVVAIFFLPFSFSKNRVVVIGASLAGSLLVSHLRSQKHFHITLIDAKGIFVDTPQLIRAILGTDVLYQVPISTVLPEEGENVAIQGLVTSVNPTENKVFITARFCFLIFLIFLITQVTLENGTVISYDYLCVCTGTHFNPANTPVHKRVATHEDFALAFDNIRADPSLYPQFVSLCHKHYAHETIAYIDSLAALLKEREKGEEADTDRMQSMAKGLLNNFILADSPQEINICARPSNPFHSHSHSYPSSYFWL